MALTKVTRNLLSTGIDDQSNATAITIDSSENVQIGSNSFAAPRLQLYAAATGESQIFFGNDGTNGFKDGAIRYFHESHATTSDRRNMTFSTANTERMRINSSGSVGIGTSNPDSLLHIEKASGNNTYLQIKQTGVESWQIGTTASSTALSFLNSGTERMKITSDGRGVSQFTAHAWVNFNGTGTVAIQDSYNVSSITDGGTGFYTVNFSNNTNANHSTVVSGDNYDVNLSCRNHLAGSVQVNSYSVTTSSLQDIAVVKVVTFGG